MKRIRLDIGALTASSKDGGSFMFFLYREGMDKCLPISLTPPEMHTVLANFKQNADDYISVQTVFFKTLQQYKVELLEVTILKKEGDGFLSELLFFDGEKEVKQSSGFIDGVILAKNFACPIYIAEELMEQYATNIDSYSKDVLDNETSLKKLKEALQEAINNEEYEKAAQISRNIEKLKKS